MPTTLRLILLLMLGLFGLQPVSSGDDAPRGFVSGTQNVVAASPEPGTINPESAASVPVNFNREGSTSDKRAETRQISNFIAAETEAAGPLMQQVEQQQLAGPSLRMTPDQQALKEIVDEATNGGRLPLTGDQANTILDWAQETGYPGVRASPGDLATPSNWTANPVPHINFPGIDYTHIPVGPGVVPR